MCIHEASSPTLQAAQPTLHIVRYILPGCHFDLRGGDMLSGPLVLRKAMHICKAKERGACDGVQECNAASVILRHQSGTPTTLS